MPGGSAVVPNSKLSQSIVTNFNLRRAGDPVDFTMRYKEDPGKAGRVALEVAAAVTRDTPHGAEVRAGDALSHLHRPWLRGTVTVRTGATGADSPPTSDGVATGSTEGSSWFDGAAERSRTCPLANYTRVVPSRGACDFVRCVLQHIRASLDDGR